MTSLSPKRRLGGLLTVAALSLTAGSLAAGALTAGPAWSADRAVEVDLSAIDALPPRTDGPPPPPIRLIPPRQARSAHTAARRAKAHTKASARRTAAAPMKSKSAPKAEMAKTAKPPRAAEAKPKMAKPKAAMALTSPPPQAAPPAAAKSSAPKPAAAAPRPPQQASRPSGTVPAAIAKASLPFPSGGDVLSAPLQSQLAPIIKAMIKAPASRLIINAYADGRDKGPGVARRTSLARALAIRNHLVSKGIDGTRTEIRPLGDTSPAGSVDRVDLVLVNR